MMESGVAVAVAILRDAYPRQDFPERTAVLYGRMLADLDDLLVVEAVRKIVKTSRFLPSIAEIREQVAEATLGLPTASEAWDLVNTGQPLPRIAQESLNALGGRWAHRMTDTPSIFRAQFVKDYDARRGALVSATMINVEKTALEVALPISTRLQERPVFARLGRRLRGEDLGPVTNGEKSDAIRVLQAGPQTEDPRDDDLYVEAERIIEEAGR